MVHTFEVNARGLRSEFRENEFKLGPVDVHFDRDSGGALSESPVLLSPTSCKVSRDSGLNFTLMLLNQVRWHFELSLRPGRAQLGARSAPGAGELEACVATAN